MASDRSTLASSEVTTLLTAAISSRIYKGKNRVLALDRISTPTLNALRSSAASGRANPIQGGYKVHVKGERGGSLQSWSGRDLLTFNSYETIFDLEYFVGRVHMGDEWVHQQLEEAGIKVAYDTSNGKIPKMAPSAMEVVINLADQKLEDFENNYVQELNKSIWRANSGDAKMFTGIDGLLPVTSNSTGTIGGKSRTNPLLRHQLATSVANDDLETKIHQIVRAANKRNVAVGTRINMAIAGENVYDRLTQLLVTGATGITARYDRNLAADQAAKWGEKLGIGVPPDALMIPGIGVLMIEPVFEQLDIEDAPATKWQNRLYLFNMSHLAFKPTEGKDGSMIPHPVPYNQRVTRISVHGEYAFCVDKPNSHAVLTITA